MNINPVTIIVLLLLLDGNGLPQISSSLFSSLRLEALLDGINQLSSILEKVNKLSSSPLLSAGAKQNHSFNSLADSIYDAEPEITVSDASPLEGNSLDMGKLMELAGPLLANLSSSNTVNK